MMEFNALRPITQRLNSTPVQELPRIAFFLASSIATCGQALQTVSNQATSRSNDNASLVHKLKTRISTLLQERSHKGRFAAVVLVKAVVEAGGREILSSSSEAWVRGLLSVLGRPDPVSTKKLCLMTITRIFSLTEQYPTLVREITTPLLPAFITACLSLIKPNIVRTEDGTTTIRSPLLEPVFRSFSELLPHHPTIFRPFTVRLNTIALTLIGDTSTPLYVTEVTSNILTTLHFSASKNEAGAEWVRTCKSIIWSCHIAADEVLRSIIEDWEGSEHMEVSVSARRKYENIVQASGPDVLGLQAWIGVHDGTQRIVQLLRLLSKFVSLPTAQPVSCPIGSIIDLTARLAGVTAIADARTSQFSVRPKAEVGRNERDELWMELPNVHIATLELLSTVLESFAKAALPITRIVLDQMMNLFEAEQRDEGLRLAAYRLTEQLLSLIGSSLTKLDVNLLAMVIKRCCADLNCQAGTESPNAKALSTTVNGSKHIAMTSIDVDSFSSYQGERPPSGPSHQRESTYYAASRLLPCFLSTLPNSAVPHSLRTEVDRTAILVQNRRAMLVSVLNPPLANQGQPAPSSVMPFLARASSADIDTEALLRPRMPAVRTANLPSNDHVDESEEGSVDSQVADYTVLDHNSNAELQEGLDLLDRLENSLDNRPMDIKQDVPDGLSLNRTAVDGNDPLALQSLSKDTTKRDLAAMYDQDPGNQDVTESHMAATVSNPEITKRRRLEDGAGVHGSRNDILTMSVGTPSLHRSELQVAVENSSLHISAQEHPKAEADTPSNTFNQDNIRLQDSDDESDFEIPEIIDSTSEGDGG